MSLRLSEKEYLLEIPLPTGQNLAMGYDNWTEAIQGWVEEKEHYVHALPSNHFFNEYKQVNMVIETTLPKICRCILDDLAFIRTDRLRCNHLSFIRCIPYPMVFLRLQLHSRVSQKLDKADQRSSFGL